MDGFMAFATLVFFTSATERREREDRDNALLLGKTGSHKPLLAQQLIL